MRYFYSFSILYLWAVQLFAQSGLDQASFDQALQGEHKGLVVIGEAHEVKSTYPTELLIIEKLLEQGYTHILLEAGPAEVAILQRYLQSNDEWLLQHTRARGEHYKTFIKGLKTLYDTYPFTLQGIDFDRSSCTSFVLQNLLSYPFNHRVDSIKFDLLKINKETKPKDYKSIIQDVESRYSIYKNDVDSLLKDQAYIIEQIVNNPVFMSDYGISSKTRDQQIYQATNEIEDEVLAKSVLIIGSNHITNSEHWWSLAQENDALVAKAKIYLFAYANCTNFLKRKHYNSPKPLSNYMEKNELEEPMILFEKIHIEEIPSKNDQITLIKLYNQ